MKTTYEFELNDIEVSAKIDNGFVINCGFDEPLEGLLDEFCKYLNYVNVGRRLTHEKEKEIKAHVVNLLNLVTNMKHEPE